MPDWRPGRYHTNKIIIWNMKSLKWKKIIPHAIAIAVFLLIAVIYCRPSLSGDVLQQSDVIHWKGMAQNAFEYKEKHGHFPLWNTNLFSGMPNYQIAMEGTKHFGLDWNTYLTLGLPKPACYFFLACVCFYILSMVLGLDVVIAVLVSLAFAYSTYDPVIIVAGHETKMSAIAYMPGVLAGILLLFKKRYFLGLGVAALFIKLEIEYNHVQVTYYLLIVIGIMTVFYVVKWIRAGAWKHMAIALSLALFSGLIGVGNSALTLLTTYEFSKYTMRGGKTIDAKNTDGTGAKEIKKTSGLDKDYAFMWSMYKAEPLVMAMPNAFGGSSAEMFDEDSKVAAAFTEAGAPAQYASQLPKYWGGLESTAGPAYIGALICFLAVIGFVVMKKGIARWWILTAAVVGIVMSWGKYFPGINGLLFDYLPFYNKFRAPSMALVIPQLVLPIMAGITLKQLFYSEPVRESLQKNFKPVLYAAGSLVLVALLVYVFNDYSSSMDDQLKSALGEHSSPILNALHSDRKAMFGAGLGHLLFFGLLTVAGIYLYVRKIGSPTVILGAFAVINTVDLLVVDSKYLNADMYQPADEVQASNFTPSPAESQILQDKDPHYRVLNMSTGDPFQDAITSYYLRSVGGYNPAKLRIYQDVIESQFSGRGGLNMNVLNMLDTRYFIVAQQGQQAAPVVEKNPQALGAAWFVKNIHFVDGQVAALNGISHFNPRDTAIVENKFQSVVKQPQYDSTASIKLTGVDNDKMEYETQAQKPQFAVLSEVYYPAGWNAYIDGKKTEYANVNYVLRGINVPAGAHRLSFVFEPRSYRIGDNIVLISNILLLLTLVLSVFGFVRTNRELTIG